MIVTVTLNPSIDKTLTLKELKVGGINRADSMNLDPGGKGVNVSRALAAMGVPTKAILICGELGRDWMERALEHRGIKHDIIESGDTVRSNLTIVHDGGKVTKINEAGSPLTELDLVAVRESIKLAQATWVVLAGRSNPGLPETTYRDLAKFSKEIGARVAVDTSGPELKHALEANAVDLIKPNQHELAELVGRPLLTIHDVISAAREVIDGGVEMVVCSLGADGAILITQSTAVHCEPAHPVKGTPVGAGDILLGTFLGAGADEEALTVGVKWSAASVPLEGTSVPTAAQAEAMEVKVNRNLDNERHLVEVE